MAEFLEKKVGSMKEWDLVSDSPVMLLWDGLCIPVVNQKFETSEQIKAGILCMWCQF